MQTTPKETFNKWDLMERWQASKRTVERHIRRFFLKPRDFTGREPVFYLADVQAMEARRVEEFKRVYKYEKPAQILTVKQVKARAGKGGVR